MIHVWTDGSSTGKLGAGGWAYLVEDEEVGTYWASGGLAEGTTNNRMEMTACCEALESLPEGSDVNLVCDASYVVNAMRKCWPEMWEGRGWLNSFGDPVANRDLWNRLMHAKQHLRSVRWVKVKGHTKKMDRASVGNRRVDAMAVRAKKKAQEGARDERARAEEGRGMPNVPDGDVGNEVQRDPGAPGPSPRQ